MMLRSIRSSNQASPLASNSAQASDKSDKAPYSSPSAAEEGARLNTRPARRKSAQLVSSQQSRGIVPPNNLAASNGHSSEDLAARPMNYNNSITLMGPGGPTKRSTDLNSFQNNNSQSSASPVSSDYGFPPMPEHLSVRQRRQSRNQEEYDTIVVGGRRASNATTDGVHTPSTPGSATIEVPNPSLAGKNRSVASNANGQGSGGRSGRPSRNSSGIGSITKGGGVIGDLNAAARRSGGGDAGSIGNNAGVDDGCTVHHTNQAIPQYHQATITQIASSGMMDYRMAAQEIMNGPQEGVMKMKDNRQETPQWSETKTKAGKERKRLPLACIACRRKKIRCSGEKPACRHCLRSRVPCVYKQSARKAAPRTDYMAMLDRRLKKMEERLIKCIPKNKAAAAVAATGRAVLKPSTTSNSKKRTVDEAFAGKELDEWSRGQPSKSSKLTETTEKQVVSKTIQVDQSDNGSSALPSMELQIHLAEVYFEYLYGQAYFLLHKPSFMRRLKEGKVPPVLILSVCAVAARFSNDPAVQHTPRYLAGKAFAAEATRLVLANFDTPNMTILTSLLLLGLHEFGTMQGGKSWSFGGMATRMAYALSLHKEPEDVYPKGLPNDPSGEVNPPYFAFMNKELRRRVMWACFTMDRFNSSGTQRLGMIIESDIEIQLPMIDKDLDHGFEKVTERLDGTVPGDVSNAQDNMGVAAYMIRVIALFGRVSKYLNLGGKDKDKKPRTDSTSQFAQLNQQILDFPKTLPARLQYNEENLQTYAETGVANQFIFIHIAYHHVRLFLHQYALPSNPREPQKTEPEYIKSSETAIDAATQISLMLAKIADKGYKLVAPFMGYCAFASSNVHLVRAFSKDRAIQEASKQHLSVNMKYLGQMKNYWGLYSHIIEVIRGQYRVYSEAMVKGNLSPRATNILQYGDWFGKYPHGNSAPNSDNESEDAVKKQKQPSQSVEQRYGDTALNFRLDLLTAEEYFARYGTLARQKAMSQAASSKSTSQAQKANITTPAMANPIPSRPQLPSTTNQSSQSQVPSKSLSISRGTSTTAPTRPPQDLEGKLDPQLSINNPMPPPPPLPPPQPISHTHSQPPSQSIMTPLEVYPVPYDQQPQQHNTPISYSSPTHMQPLSSPSPTSFHQHQPFSAPLLSRPEDHSHSPSTIAANQHLTAHPLSRIATQYLYNTYSSPGPEPVPSPSTPLGWSFDQTPHHAMINPFQDQASAAWFMPFNLDTTGMYASGGMTLSGGTLLGVEDEMNLASHHLAGQLAGGRGMGGGGGHNPHPHHHQGHPHHQHHQ